MTAPGATAALLEARWLRRLAIIALVMVTLALPFGAPSQALATIEQIYTLPFFSDHTISCGFGCYSGHEGTDYKLGEPHVGGDAVVAAAGGTAWLYQQFPPGAGYYIVIDHDNGHRTRYMHLASRIVTSGETVERGQTIGYEGNTGTDNYHLHFETRHNGTSGENCCSGTPVDPYASSTFMWTTDPPNYYEGTDTAGVWWARSWRLRNSNDVGVASIPVFEYGEVTDTPLTGDWDGDGDDTIGVWRAREWLLRDFNDGGQATVDPFEYGEVADTPLTGDRGSDTIMGGRGRDTLEGGDGDDTLYGKDGNDTLRGNAHDDTLFGGRHDDLLDGGGGDDALDGGYGVDVCDGGPGTDTKSQCEA